MNASVKPAAAVLWGASFPLGKLALAGVPPSYLTFYRFVLVTRPVHPKKANV